MNHEVTIAYCAQDLKGVGHELILDRVTGTLIGEFLNGNLFPNKLDVISSDIKTQCAVLKDEPTIVLKEAA